jgi:hypothetical protein
MKEVQKFTSLAAMKKAEETVSNPVDSEGIRNFLELLRQGEMPAQNNAK